jgi:hypothetical protein
MAQFFFLVILPGIAPYIGLALAVWAFVYWVVPKIQLSRARARMATEQYRRMQTYTREASGVIAEMLLQIEHDPAAANLTPELKRDIYRLASDPVPDTEGQLR